jgi:UDP-N-acetylglucosamine--N-acetylmuramyl-(pentapeptide) pyrophosphoryl-undecaprenol N-acetylglucosamine transferase
MRLAIGTGGTGGHIYPGIGIAEAAVSLGLADDVLFIGGRHGLESELVPAHGFDIVTLPVDRVRGMKLATRMAGLAGLARSIPAASRVLKEFSPDAVIGMGGYASAPSLIAASMRKIPTVLCEQNTIPGATNRKLAHFASRICVSFPMTSGYLPSWKVVVTGNPVRASIGAAAARRQESPREGFRILVLGGSQGALFLNQTVAGCLASFAATHGDVEIVHQAGSGRTGEATPAYGGLSRVHVTGYIDDMAEMLAWATIVVGRAGATTVAELAAVGVPSLLVPFPFATDNHQYWNAKAMVTAGAARIFEQHSFNENKFRDTLEELHRGPEVLAAMEEGASNMGRPKAAVGVLETLGGVV